MDSRQGLLLEHIDFKKSPFPHFSTDVALDIQLANRLLSWLIGCDFWSYTETSFYTQYEFSLLQVDLPEVLHPLRNPVFISKLAGTFEKFFGARNLELVGITAHRLEDGYKMGVHNDFIGEEETHRLVIQLNKGWDENNGGYLMLFSSKNPDDISSLIMPIHNTAVAFEISRNSYHAVSTVHKFNRYTLVYTFNSTNLNANQTD